MFRTLIGTSGIIGCVGFECLRLYHKNKHPNAQYNSYKNAMNSHYYSLCSLGSLFITAMSMNIPYISMICVLGGMTTLFDMNRHKLVHEITNNVIEPKHIVKPMPWNQILLYVLFFSYSIYGFIQTYLLDP
jgi:hypothetical protein